MKKIYSREEDFPWKTNSSYPEELRRNYRYRHMIDDPHLSFGILELDAGATYPPHVHPSPEIYYLIAGRALWNVDGAEKELSPGAMIEHAEGAVHSFKNIGTTPLKLLWIWWAKGGHTEFLKVAAKLV